LTIFFKVKIFKIFNLVLSNGILHALILFIVSIFYGCSPYKAVPKGQYLLKGSKIKLEKPIKKPQIEEIEAQIRIKPNRKILGIYRFHVRAYSLGTRRRKTYKNEQKKVRKFLRNKVGEAPVLLDTNLIERSTKNINQLFFNKGYFNNKVSYSVKYKGIRRKRAFVTYFISPKEVFTIQKYQINSSSYDIDSILNHKDNLKKVITLGNQIDFDELIKERTNINNLLRNSGYYYFGKEYIEFDIDTMAKKVNVEAIILNPENDKSHQRVVYGKTYVSIPLMETYARNLIEIIEKNNASYELHGYPLDPEILQKRITITKGNYFSQAEIDRIYVRLTEIGLFRIVDISFKQNILDTLGTIDLYINLIPHAKQAYTIEPQGIISYDIPTLGQTSNNGNFGVGNAFTYINRNTFGKAEQLDLSAVTSFQAQFGGSTNTFVEQSVNARLKLPASRLLKNIDKNPKILNVSTQIGVSYIYQDNPDFNRNILPLTLTYLINKTKRNNWQICPIDINFNRSIVGRSYYNGLNPDQQKFIDLLFNRNLLASSHISYFTLRPSLRSEKRTWFIKANVLELGGNSLFALARIFNFKKDAEGAYNLLGVPFSQFIKSDIDIRLTKKIDENNTFVYRINTGIALPYINRKVLPIDKRYFIGGANSLRGWNPRAMGPGNYNDSSNTISLVRTGELLFVCNIEYRFDLIDNKAELAIFMDAGNVWDITQGTKGVEKFSFNNMFNSTALNTGLGLRLNFQFFMIRLDWGIRMHNPALPINERWIIKDIATPNFFTKQTCLNFGLDYPF